MVHVRRNQRNLQEISANFFYEGFRFSQSTIVPIGYNKGVLQPRSESDIFGINFTFVF